MGKDGLAMALSKDTARAMDREIKKLEADKEPLQTEIDRFNKKINALTGERAKLLTQMENLDNSIANIKKDQQQVVRIVP